MRTCFDRAAEANQRKETRDSTTTLCLSGPRFALAVCASVALLLATSPSAQAVEAELTSRDDELQRILSNHQCPCGCGTALPGGGRAHACFGCSVAKAEVSFIRESLAEGRSTLDIVMSLNESVLIEVFADYTDPKLAATWKRARRVAIELDQHRVVLRAPAATTEARFALELVECARRVQRFSLVRDALIEHAGPWKPEALLALAESLGLERVATRQCLESIDLTSQIAKDRQHAEQRRITRFPTVSVNRELVFDTEEAIRTAVRRVVLEKSF